MRQTRLVTMSFDKDILSELDSRRQLVPRSAYVQDVLKKSWNDHKADQRRRK